MSERIPIVFIGGLTNGKIVLEYLVGNKHVHVPLAITYQKENSKPRNVDLTSVDGVERLIRDSNANEHIVKIRDVKPEFIFVAGWSELLSKELISLPRSGTIGFHPSKLPYDRGRSVLAWQIEENYTESALTMFCYNEIPDGGDIIAQEKFRLEENDYINDVLNKVDDATYNLMRAYFPLIRKGLAPRNPQDLTVGNFRRLRTDRDSRIDWHRNAKEVYNKIRAISKPYPGAFTEYEGKRVQIWQSELLSQSDVKFCQNAKCGEVVAKLRDNKYLVKCRDCALKIIAEDYLEVGAIL